MTIEQVELGVTKDGFKINCVISRVARPRLPPWVILVHQLGTDHTEYDGFSHRLAAYGINTLALDLRGHGDSVVRTNRRPKVTDYHNLSPHDWRRSYRDVALAIKRVRAERAPFALMGSSLGAAAVITAAARDSAMLEETALVLLSPGLNYRGVDVTSAWPSLRGLPILVVLAAYDGQAVAFRQWVQGAAQDTTTRFLVASDNAHGVKLLSSGKVTQQCLKFLTSHLGK